MTISDSLPRQKLILQLLSWIGLATAAAYFTFEAVRTFSRPKGSQAIVASSVAPGLVINRQPLQTGASLDIAGSERQTVLYIFQRECTYCSDIKDSVAAILPRLGGFDAISLGIRDTTGGEYWAGYIPTFWLARPASLDSVLTPTLILVAPGGRVIERWVGADSVLSGLGALSQRADTLALRPIEELARDLILDEELAFPRAGAYTQDPQLLPAIFRASPRVAIDSLSVLGKGRGYYARLSDASRRLACTVSYVGGQGEPKVECRPVSP